MARMKQDQILPFEVAGRNVVAGDLLTYTVGPRAGTSFGRVVRVAGNANVRLLDLSHFGKEIYVQRSAVTGFYTGEVPADPAPVVEAKVEGTEPSEAAVAEVTTEASEAGEVAAAEEVVGEAAEQSEAVAEAEVDAIAAALAE